MTIPVILFLLVVVLFVFLISWQLFVKWEQDFASKRGIVRPYANNPSHGALPHLRDRATTVSKIHQNAERHAKNFQDLNEYHALGEIADYVDAESYYRGERGARTAIMTPKDLPPCFKNCNGDMDETSSRRNERIFKKHVEYVDGELDNMYNHSLSFGQYVSSWVLVGPNAFWLWVTGNLALIIREKLYRMGWIEPKIVDYPTVVGKLCLESIFAIHYNGKKKDADGNEVANFAVSDFPGVLQDGSYKVFDLLAVDINLKTKRMVKGRLDGTELEAHEMAILLVFYGISANHVKLHSVSNWAINMETVHMKKNPFIGRNSIITTIYNYFGCSIFPLLFPAFKALGLIDNDWDPASLISTWQHGMKENVVSHAALSDLIPYSDFVEFTCKLRPYFLKEFSKVKKFYFPACHGEALFVGTILHSLDHCQMEWNIEDALWLDVDHPEYGKMAQLGQVVRVGFVSDIPGLLFHRRYKGSGHPFYEKIYAVAATINVKLADCMDTCIVK